MNEPRFILSRKIVLQKYNEIKELGVEVSFSYKTNNEVGEVLKKETDCSFSAHTINNVGRLNCNNRVWFFAQGWDKEQVKLLLNKDLKGIVVDNINDLNVLLSELKESKKKINLLLRMKLKENTIHTGRHFVYGFPSKEVKELIPKLRENKFIEKLGIHFHRKTQNISEWNYLQELQMTFSEDFFDQIDIINIGGGLPALYKNVTDQAINGIKEKIKELVKYCSKKKIVVISEPGRFISAPSVKLETEIINIYDKNIILNCSIFQGALDSFIVPIKLIVEGELDEGDSFVLKGFSPDSSDIFRYKVFLKNPKIGDKIVFLNAGAYNYSTNFLGMNKISTCFVD
jgi:ornithine decarboxylase